MPTTPTPRRVLILREDTGHHIAFTARARLWLESLRDTATGDPPFVFEYLSTPAALTDTLLDSCDLFLQLDYPPYGWPAAAEAAFIRYIEAGRGGWVGLHHASLLGPFDGHPLWSWFSGFLGGIIYRDYIPGFAAATVRVEDPAHPALRGVPAAFPVAQEEWYIYDRSPRPHPGIRVLATVDETTYTPDSPVKMGDHPVVWTSDTVPARSLYIFMGHSPALFDNPAYVTLLRNALFWAARYGE